MADFDLVRDVLDEQLVDSHERPIGKADGVVAELRDDAPPRVVAIEVGLPVLGGRLHPALRPWLEAFSRWMGMPGGGVTRLPLVGFEVCDTEIRMPIDGRAAGLFAWEDWVKRHIVARLPWGR